MSDSAQNGTASGNRATDNRAADNRAADGKGLAPGGEEFSVGGIDLRELPKVSLHDHLDGGLRPQTIIEIAQEQGLDLPADNAADLGAWFGAEMANGSLVEYLKRFEVTISVMQSKEGLARVAREFVEDLHADGVIYGEIRWAPEQHLSRGLSLDEAVEAVQGGLEDGIAAVAAKGGRIRVGQLISAMRQNDRGLEIAKLAVRHRNHGAVGFDIAGPEDGFPAGRMKDAFDYLASEFFPATVHAGEAAGRESIKGALLDGRAIRLGHGVRIAEDIEIGPVEGGSSMVTVGQVAEWVKDREIALEVSPTSNLQTGAFAAWGSRMSDHPFDLLYQLGFRVTVNPDNRLMSQTSVSRELGLLGEAFGYDLGDLEIFQLNAAAASFLPIEEREELAEVISAAFAKA